MPKHTVTFRLDSHKVSALDDLASALDRDRSYLLNEAVDVYLETQQWQLEHIKAAVRQADAGPLLEHDEVKRMASSWRRR